MFKRLGSRGRSVSIRSDSHNQCSYSRYTEALSESKDSGGKHWKSRSKKKKSNREEEDDLSQPWRDEESTEDFVKRYKLESRDVKGASKCMRISGFMHGITNPELIKRLHDKISITVDEMMRVTTSFLRGKWQPRIKSERNRFNHGNNKRVTRNKISRKEDSRSEIKAPPPMTTPVEKRNHTKFCEFHGEVNDNTKLFSQHIILFPPLDEEEGTEGPMIIEAEIRGHCIHRMYMDGGSASEILIRNEEHSASAWMNFMVVRSPSLYNRIIRRPGVRKLQAVLSTAYRILKLPVKEGVITLKSTSKSHMVPEIALAEIIDRQLPFEYTITSRSTDVVVSLRVAPVADSEANVLVEWNALYDAYNEVAYVMLGSMTPEIHRQFENYSPYEMLQELKSIFEKQARVERFDLIQIFHACKQKEGKPVAAYVLQMKGYADQLKRLGYMLPQDLIVGLILNGLTKDFAGFVRNYNIHNIRNTIGELHAMLIEYEKGLPKKDETPQVMKIKGGKIQKSKKKSLKAKGKGKANGKGNDKQVYIPKTKNPKPSGKEHPAKHDTYHHCNEVGH
nr:hypothetical protein [Tanacetum cinerariifolium]